MPNGIRTQRNFNGGEPFQEDLRNRSNIIIGALICGGGLALLTFVGMQFYIALKDHTDKFIALYLLASIFLFSLTTYILFSLINFSGQNLKLPRSTLIVVATYAAIAGIYFIFHIFFSYHPPAQEITETHFVLALDADDKGIPQHVIEWSANLTQNRYCRVLWPVFCRPSSAAC
ncbi:hypothetical protein [Asticcacaulis solisilvae]|uniref:hypothetical protein n=1 Tax=Asticcacaulis solisilvae TaxID=1217274 RepID=UPI003FD6FF3D